MKMLNTTTIMGRLTTDPNLSQTPSNISVCKFSVAVYDDYQNKDGKHATQFIPVIAWRATAEFISRNFTKGKLIIVQGKLKNNNYEKDGVKHYSMQLEAENVYFGGDKPHTSSDSVTTQPEPEELSEYEELLADTVPFE
jgi:single-strand DNA-binding protein